MLKLLAFISDCIGLRNIVIWHDYGISISESFASIGMVVGNAGDAVIFAAGFDASLYFSPSCSCPHSSH
jgi:hypothetical protein